MIGGDQELLSKDDGTIATKNGCLALLGGSVVKNPTASRGHKFDVWSVKIPCAGEQLSLCIATIEPVF